MQKKHEKQLLQQPRHLHQQQQPQQMHQPHQAMDMNKSSNYIYNENLFTTNVEKKGSPFLVNQPPTRQNDVNENDDEDDDDESFSLPSAPPPPTPKSILSPSNKKDGGTVTASIGLGPNQMVANTYARANNHDHYHYQEQHVPKSKPIANSPIANTKQNLYKNFSVDPKKKSPQTHTTHYMNDEQSSWSSSCSNAELNAQSVSTSSSLSNLYEAKNANTNSQCNNNGINQGRKSKTGASSQSKFSNVRHDKHVIKQYIYDFKAVA